MVRSKTIIATPPGATIKEQLIDQNMRQKEFALRMDMSQKHISRLINGEVQLTPDVAMRLEMVLGIPAHFWNQLEMIYREKLIKAEEENQMEEDLKIIKKIPYKEMSENGWVPKTRNAKERVVNVRKFFEVVRLNLLTTPLTPSIAYRKLGDGKKSDYALISWVQRAKLEARDIKVNPINITKLKRLIPKIRRMTTKKPEEFAPELREKLAECGIALVFLPHIGGSFLHGATFFDGSKIVIGMTVRGKDADKFWFSLLHELAHVVLGHIKQEDSVSVECEREADEFARNVLIPEEDFSSFVRKGDFEEKAIYAFADKVEIDVGIVVGRLQKEEYINYTMHNALKTKYEVSASSKI